MLAPARHKFGVLGSMLLLYFTVLGGAYALAFVSILVFGLLGAFVIGPPLLIFGKGVALFGLVLGVPLALLTLAVSALRGRQQPALQTEGAGIRWFFLFLKGITLAAALALVLIGAAYLYVQSLPRITYQGLDLQQSSQTGGYPEDTVARIAESPEFEEYVRDKFPYRHDRAGERVSFASPEEFEQTDAEVWRGVRDSLAFQFLSKLQFCQGRPFFKIIPSCIYFNPNGGTYLIEVQ